MKALVTVLLVLLLIAVLLPLGMGMAMGCSPHATVCSATIGVCAAVLGIFMLLVITPLGVVRERRLIPSAVLFVTALERPPRLLIVN